MRFTAFWGKTYNPAVIDELAAPNVLLKYSLHKPRHGRDDIKAFMHDFPRGVSRSGILGNGAAAGPTVTTSSASGRAAARIRAPHIGDFLVGALPANSGRTMHFTGITILKLKDGKILQEVGLDDGATALTQLGLLVKRS